MLRPQRRAPVEVVRCRATPLAVESPPPPTVRSRQLPITTTLAVHDTILFKSRLKQMVRATGSMPFWVTPTLALSTPGFQTVLEVFPGLPTGRCPERRRRTGPSRNLISITNSLQALLMRYRSERVSDSAAAGADQLMAYWETGKWI